MIWNGEEDDGGSKVLVAVLVPICIVIVLGIGIGIFFYFKKCKKSDEKLEDDLNNLKGNLITEKK